MKIIETIFFNKIVKHSTNKLGHIFFFKHIAIVELNEGIHFNKKNSALIIDELNSFFGDSKPYGVISNRINSYSIDLINMSFYRKKAKNVCAYGVVGYSFASKMAAKLENRFCKSKKVNYNSIYEAIDSVCNKVKKNRAKSYSTK